ncbi:tRNA epoxyqueuosine(34) reductase QueG [Litoribacterium kuwaitense]|uniref:tRNA epoxyqueuosine(34) reductase QueG n=1 Tax=Litoribacterium kuwaitense TaxID=1398745 RepID=UPI0028A7A440|nr:tRNA epoxyqueuosine(34) reductase QueG [Litoribacterium kuwaitense]
MNKALKEDIIRYSQEIGIDSIGFASADPFLTLKERLKTQQALNYQSGFEEPDIEKRTHPELLLPQAKSIISIALAYPSKMKNPPRSTKKDPRGIFARASWGEDYHTVLRDRLDKLQAYVLEKMPDAYVTSMVDTGELSDRAVAERAGIGFSGKNCAIISPKFGSYIYLGEMITSIPFEPDQPIEDGCGDCNICVDACPTDALIQGGQLNAQRCISFLTQTKGFLQDEFRRVIGNRLYGCDTCQTVCPKNKGVDFHTQEEFEPEPEKVKPLLKPLLDISNRQFKETYGAMSGSWRGKKPIQRNAILALALYKDEGAVPKLMELVKKDPRPVIRGTSAWAIGKITTDPEAVKFLEKQLDVEEDEEVREEIFKGLRFQREEEA